MDFTSRQLRALLAVADRRSFSRAAEMLYMTPSGVSVLIRELESQLGFRMFDRTTRSVSLTGQGNALVPVIRRALADLEGAAAALSESAKETGQSVSLGAAPLIAANVLPAAIKAYRAVRPGATIHTFDADLTTVMQKVESGAIDLGIGVFPPSSSVRRVRLFRFSFIFIRPADDAARAASSTTWSAAAAETLVVLPAASPVQRAIDRQLGARGRAARTVTVNNLDTQIAMVEAGEGAAIIPSFGLPVCRNRKVMMSRLVNPAVTMDFHQIHRRGGKLAPAAEDFASFLESFVSRWAGHAGIL